MHRSRATTLLTNLLTNLDTGHEEAPLRMVTEIFVFGSYARGAPQPRDVDVAVEFAPDKDWTAGAVMDMAYGRDIYAPLRRALVRRSRGIQFAFNQRAELHDIPMTLLWRRGDALEVALARLAAIVEDPTAGPAERTQMLPAFEGIDDWVPRPLRAALIDLVDLGAITVEQVTLPDATITDRRVRAQIEQRWAPASPLRRAAAALLADGQARGLDPANVLLQGEPLVLPRRRTPASPATPAPVAASTPTTSPGRQAWFASFRWRHVDHLTDWLTEQDGVDWTEVVRPTQTLPLLALRITPTDRAVLAFAPWPLSGEWRHRLEAFGRSAASLGTPGAGTGEWAAVAAVLKAKLAADGNTSGDDDDPARVAAPLP